MPETLAVHLNRSGPRDIAPEAASLETDRPFELAFENHGGPVHVHLHFDDVLDAVARTESTQVYVDGGETRRVTIDLIENPGTVKGYVDVSTGYGAEEARVNVAVTNPRKDGGPTVAVDNSLSEKQTTDPDVSTSATKTAANVWPFVIAAFGVGIAVLLVLSIPDSLGLITGVLALLCTIGIATYLLYQQE